MSNRSTKQDFYQALHGFSLPSLLSEQDSSPVINKYTSIRDKYRIGQLVGTGAYSIVKMAEEIETGEAVAIKIIKKYDLSADQLEMVYYEIYALQ